MFRLCRPFVHDSRGTTAIAFAFLTIALGLSAGVAIDYSRAHHAEAMLQRAADAAALAGASLTDVTAESRIAAATRVFGENVHVATAPTPTVTYVGGTVAVTAAIDLPTTLMRLADGGVMQIGVVAEAIAMVPPLACVLTLEENQFGLQANSGSTLDAACGIQVNSAHSEAVYVNSASNIVGTGVSVYGDAVTNSGSTIAPAPAEGAPRVTDPLATLPEPFVGACDHTDFSVNSASSATMTPGVYCGVTLINSLSAVAMEPGIYVFRGGEFVINSLSSVTGQGVMLYFADVDARLNVNSGSRFNVSAPTSGPYQGMLMFQSRNPSTISAPPFIVNSNGLTEFEGVIYLPNGRLELNSISTANSGATYTAIVVNQMVLNSFGTFKVNANYEGTTPLPSLLSGLKGPTLARLTK